MPDCRYTYPEIIHWDSAQVRRKFCFDSRVSLTKLQIIRDNYTSLQSLFKSCKVGGRPTAEFCPNVEFSDRNK